MKRYKAVLYDIDGTMLNTLDMNLYPLLRIIREELGEERTLDDVLKYYAYPGMETLRELGIQDRETVYARWVRYVNEYETGATLYDGMETVLESFRKAGVLQAVVSSKNRAQYAIDVTAKGLDVYMAAAVLADDTERHKPHPEPILECLRRLGVRAEEAVYVGDSRSDFTAAKAAGVDFAYARWGSVSDEGFENADWRFDKPAELLSLLPKE